MAIRDQMHARGPDGFGAWQSGDGTLILGHRRLSIIDISERAAQPMLSGDGRFVIVFNGEIYNFPDLKTSLAAQGTIFRTTSDTETLLHLYAKKGEAMLADLRGMFTFAIWDNQERSLFLARDPYGIKPLYYADDGNTFRFASQVKALLAGGSLSRVVDSAGLAGFCLFGSVPEPFTFYSAIKALPAGHSVTLRLGGAPASPRAYASIAAVLANAGPAQAKDDLGGFLREVTLESVRAHLLADVEVGVFLSAGVDSGALLGLMRDAGQDRIRAITLAFSEFEQTDADEAPLSRDVARRYGADHVIRRVNREEFETDLPAIFAAMDQPTIDGVNTWFVSKAAHEAELKVALSGLGGDELLGGYDTFSVVPHWVRLLGWTQLTPGLGGAVRSLGEALAPTLAAQNPKALALLEHGATYQGAYLIRRALFAPHEVPKIIGVELAREGLAALGPFELTTRAMTPEPRAPSLRVAALEASLYMRNQLLRDTDWAGMAHSLEIRPPLVDYFLLRKIATELPRLHDVGGKRLLANAPSTPLPESVCGRRKTGFGIPMKAWMAGTSGGNDRLTSRSWARRVLAEFGIALDRR